jgi:hypothetical protein
MLYHQTKDPYYVKDFLGHKSLASTEIYINIERTMFESACDEFTGKVTEKPEEVKALLEAGFEYVCQKDSLAFLRKRKRDAKNVTGSLKNLPGSPSLVSNGEVSRNSPFFVKSVHAKPLV